MNRVQYVPVIRALESRLHEGLAVRSRTNYDLLQLCCM
jgi:hypothetical protein